jgi:hypothetical protein
MADEITPRDGPPAGQQKYDQAFFLALAAKGKDAWNHGGARPIKTCG